jgi:hypothetical protein
MRDFSNSLARSSPCLLAVLTVCLIPAALRAENVTFRNDCPFPLVIQTATLRNGTLYRDQAQLIRSGERTTPIRVNADKILSVYDGKSNRTLYRDALRATTKELHYSINAMANPRFPGRVQMIIRQIPPPPRSR